MKRLAIILAVGASALSTMATSTTYQSMQWVGSSCVTISYTVYDEFASFGSFSGLSSYESFSISTGYGGRRTLYVCDNAFLGSEKLVGITIPAPVESIGEYVFCGCSSLTNVSLPPSLGKIGKGAFSSCTSLQDLTIPYGVTNVGAYAFHLCTGLTNISFSCNRPTFGSAAFEGVPTTATLTIKDGATGWDPSAFAPNLPPWGSRKLIFENDTEEPDDPEEDDEKPNHIYLTVTNIVIHYIRTSEVADMAAPISKDVGLVNVITEIKGGCVPIPESWRENYPRFQERFGTDFSKALTKPTGKRDAAGQPMMVWQDFVAGTDPTDDEAVFTASVTIVGGKPVVSYTPELSPEEKAKRVYKTWGKAKLQDEDWAEVETGEEDNYNFFKVSVEMK